MDNDIVLIGFQNPRNCSPVYFSNQLWKVKPGTTIEIPLALATGESSTVFRNELIKLFAIKSIEIVPTDEKSKTMNTSVRISLTEKPSNNLPYQINFKYIQDNAKEYIEHTGLIDPTLLTESLLPQYFTPERLNAIDRLKSTGTVVPLDTLFNISFGQNLATSNSRVKEAPTVRGRYILSGHISKERFIDDSFSDNLSEIPFIRSQQSIKTNDIIISAFGGTSPSTSFAMVIAPEPLNTYHTHATIKLSPLSGVDPKFSSLFFALWSTESYRNLYCFTPNVIKSLQISQLGKLPIPTNPELLDRAAELVGRLKQADAETKQVYNKFDSLTSGI
ncbi:MAG: hypothetical protein JNL74_08285 [Fibrobacteres bacterium]|nr:hypothetical protein [Fibrobacterota bacterium]